TPERRVRRLDLALELLQLVLELLRLRDVLALLARRLRLVLDLVEESHVRSPFERWHLPTPGRVASPLVRGLGPETAVASRRCSPRSASIIWASRCATSTWPCSGTGSCWAPRSTTRTSWRTRACTPWRCASATAHWSSC